MLRTIFRLIALIIALSIPGLLRAQDAGDFPLRPGAIHPPPLQRGLNEIEDMPTREAACPACGRKAEIPLVDKLVRAPAGAEAKWQMHAASRDADLAPYPGRNKLAYQADIVICPDCGFSVPAARFEEPLPPETRAWALATLRPNLRSVQRALLGKRAADMAEADIIAFFNRQEAIPDSVRTEHYRIYTLAAQCPKLVQAEAAWLAAWAIRRETAGPPKGDFLAGRWAEVGEAVASRLKSQPAFQGGEAEMLRYLMGKTRSGKDRLGYGDRLAARLKLAALDIRQGLYGSAADRLGDMLGECRERFLKPDQDPLWPNTSPRASRSYRLSELETMRSEAEAEIAVRLLLVHSELDLLEKAADLLRAAIRAGECPDRENALFHSYLIGEFLRRCNHLPLAAEWFKNLVNLAGNDTQIAKAAKRQLDLIDRQAGENVNLLSALGQDGETFEKLREIMQTRN